MSQVTIQTIEPREALKLARRAASMAKVKADLDNVRREFGKKVGESGITIIAAERNRTLETVLKAVREGQAERAKIFMEKLDDLSNSLENIRKSINALPERQKLSELSKRFYRLTIEVAAIGQKYVHLLLETPEE